MLKPDRQWRSSSFQECKKVHVSRDLWPWPWAHPECTLTRRPSCASLVAIRPCVGEKKRFVQKFTQTDRWTDDVRRTTALAHSWNELTISTQILHTHTYIHLQTWHTIYCTNFGGQMPHTRPTGGWGKQVSFPNPPRTDPEICVNAMSSEPNQGGGSDRLKSSDNRCIPYYYLLIH